MPMYEFYCEDCKKEVTLVLNFSCPHCKGKKLEPLLTGFFAKTSRKS